MSDMTLRIRRRRDVEGHHPYTVVAEHPATKSRGFGQTVDEAVSDLFTCRLVIEAADRCELPTGRQK